MADIMDSIGISKIFKKNQIDHLEVASLNGRLGRCFGLRCGFEKAKKKVSFDHNHKFGRKIYEFYELHPQVCEIVCYKVFAFCSTVRRLRDCVDSGVHLD